MQAHLDHRRQDAAAPGAARWTVRGAVVAVLAAIAASAAASSGASASTNDPQLPRAAWPVADASVTLVQRTGSATVLWPGVGWLPLVRPAALPLGTTIDATDATVLITSARSTAGATQRENVSGGAFAVTQTAGPEPTTRLLLASTRSPRCASPRSTAVVRRLSADGDGRLQIVAADISATTQAADWVVSDRCDGTEVSVRSGRVTVRRTRTHPGETRLVVIVRARTSVFLAGPPPGAAAVIASPGPAVASPSPSGAAPTTTAPTASGSTPAAPTTPTPASTPDAEQQLVTLTNTVQSLDLSGADGDDLLSDIDSVQTALSFGTTADACTALGLVGQDVFANAGDPTGAFTATAAAALLGAMGTLDATLPCATPDTSELSADGGLLTTLGAVSGLDLDPNVAASLTEQLVQAGQSFVVGDDSDGCQDVHLAADAVSLLELSYSQGQSGLTALQGEAITADIDPVQTQAGC